MKETQEPLLGGMSRCQGESAQSQLIPDPPRAVKSCRVSFDLQVFILKEPTDSFPVGHFPQVLLILPAHLALVNVCMAGVTKSCDPIVVGLDRAALPIPELVGVGCHHGPIPSATELTR